MKVAPSSKVVLPKPDFQQNRENDEKSQEVRSNEKRKGKGKEKNDEIASRPNCTSEKIIKRNWNIFLQRLSTIIPDRSVGWKPLSPLPLLPNAYPAGSPLGEAVPCLNVDGVGVLSALDLPKV